MTTASIIAKENDILDVIRELEERSRSAPVPKAETVKTDELPDPLKLKASLERKLQFINLLDGQAGEHGYVNRNDIEEIRNGLKSALVDLDEIIDTTA